MTESLIYISEKTDYILSMMHSTRRQQSFLEENTELDVIYKKELNSENSDKNTDYLLIKMLALIGFLLLNFIIGLIPTNFNKKSEKKRLSNIISYSNTFGAALGLCSSLFLVLPKAGEIIEGYFDSSGGEERFGHLIVGIPWAFLSCFFSYSLSLVVQKIMFSEPKDDHSHSHLNLDDEGTPRKSIKEKQEQADENEQSFKDVVGPRGRFSTFMGIRNLKKSLAKEGKDIQIKKNTSIIRASMVLSKSMSRPDKYNIFKGKDSNFDKNDMNLFVNPDNIDVSERMSSHSIKKSLKKQEIENIHENPNAHGSKSTSSPLMAYLLLGAISFHGFFQGFSIGILDSNNEILGLSICFLIHKSIESLSIGQVLKLSGINNFSYLSMLMIYVSFCPLGILVGSFSETNGLVKGVFLGVCVGSIMYQCISETLIQEFTFTEKRYQKFLTFISASILVVLVTLIIKL